MQELRFVAVSEDGRYAVLGIPGRSARFTLPIDERLRAVALGQTSRLAQYEIEVESPLRPKEIQARIRAGETVEEIADAAGIAVERVRWFEGPVLAERSYMADQAQTASVRRHGDSTPGPRLGEIVAARLKAVGADPDDAQWDAKKRGDGSWQVQLMFTSAGRLHTADWVFDPRRRHVLPIDDNAARMSLPGAEPPRPAPSGRATVTELATRLGAGHGQGSGARHERPGPGRAPVAAPVAPTPPQPATHPAPSAPATTEQHDDAPRRPAAERRPRPPTAPGQPASAPAAADDDYRAVPASVASAPQAGPAGPSTAAEPAGQQAGRRKTARGRRSSVPSWDEIMFGSSRQRD
jgi:hypothetical protein